MLGEYPPGEIALWLPFRAARWDDERTALSAALDGSRVCSMWLVCRWVGEEFLGITPSVIEDIFLVESWRLRPTVCDVDGVGTGGDIMVS